MDGLAAAVTEAEASVGGRTGWGVAVGRGRVGAGQQSAGAGLLLV